MVHVLLVVSRDAPELFGRLAKEFAGVEGIKVVTDRRLGQRRRGSERGGAERRRGDRRKQSATDPRLGVDGWTLADAVTDTDRPVPAVAPLSHTDPRKVAELLDAIQTLSRELDITRLLQIIMDKASRLLNADRSSLFVVDEERAELRSKIAQGLEVREIRVPIGQGIAGSVAAAGERVNIADAYADPRFNQEVDRRTGYRSRTILCAPVRDGQGAVVGVAQVLNKAGGPFTRDDEGLLAALSAQAFIALDNARLFESVVTMKNYDESIFSCMATGVMTLDREGAVTSLNPALRRIFGVAAEADAGNPVRALLDVKHNEAFVVRLDACARAGEAHTEYELKYVLGPEESVNVNVSVVPLLDSKHQPLTG
jgi:adenylate cyclase